jgi:hypothetical protein
MSIVGPIGRLCNQVFGNLAASFIAEKNNLFVTYHDREKVEKLGFKLFVGEKKYNSTVDVKNKNYLQVLNNPVNENIIIRDYMQTKEISHLIYDFFRRDDIRESIVHNNRYKDSYNNNNDCFVHVRVGDAKQFNPGLDYYVNTIKSIKYDNLYISSDELTHKTMKTLQEIFPEAKIVTYDDIDTIKFASTCKYLILSNGTYSAIMGYLAYYSQVYYPQALNKWHGDVFSFDHWNIIKLS